MLILWTPSLCSSVFGHVIIIIIIFKHYVGGFIWTSRHISQEVQRLLSQSCIGPVQELLDARGRSPAIAVVVGVTAVCRNWNVKVQVHVRTSRFLSSHRVQTSCEFNQPRIEHVPRSHPADLHLISMLRTRRALPSSPPIRLCTDRVIITVGCSTRQ
jgi:hypothetical protein